MTTHTQMHAECFLVTQHFLSTGQQGSGTHYWVYLYKWDGHRSEHNKSPQSQAKIKPMFSSVHAFHQQMSGLSQIWMLRLVAFQTSVFCSMLIQCAVWMCALCVGVAVAPTGCCVCQKNQGSRAPCSQCDRLACSSCTQQCSSCSSLCCSICTIIE